MELMARELNLALIDVGTVITATFDDDRTTAQHVKMSPRFLSVDLERHCLCVWRIEIQAGDGPLVPTAAMRPH